MSLFYKSHNKKLPLHLLTLQPYPSLCENQATQTFCLLTKHLLKVIDTSNTFTLTSLYKFWIVEHWTNDQRWALILAEWNRKLSRCSNNDVVPHRSCLVFMGLKHGLPNSTFQQWRGLSSVSFITRLQPWQSHMCGLSTFLAWPPLNPVERHKTMWPAQSQFRWSGHHITSDRS